MIRADVALDTETLDTLHAAAAALPDVIRQYAKDDLRPFVSQQVDKTLRVEPPVRQWPGDYPLPFDTAKQRRWYFANAPRDSAGHVQKYVRTHGYVQAWQVRGDYEGGLTAIHVTNTSDAADFIGGRRQQRFHARTGWPNAPDILQEISLLAQARLEAALPSLIFQTLRRGRGPRA